MRRLELALAFLSTCAVACSSGGKATSTSTSSSGTSTGGPPPDIAFGTFGSSSAKEGKNGFRFGASSAATQIEDMNTNTDWYKWTDPKQLNPTNSRVFVGDAVKGYTMAIEDVKLLQAMHVDSYRFSIEWARVEPQKGMIDETAMQHYSDLLDALKAAGIRPNVTIHHFSNPVWVDDPGDPGCMNGPSFTNLCGLDDDTGGPMVVSAMADHATLLAQRFGDRVDDWATLNEPVNYLIASYGAGIFPPGKHDFLEDPTGRFVNAIRNYVAAHAAMYKAIKAADTIDADGDGVAASVGLTKEAAEWVASHGGALTTNTNDVNARTRVEWLYQYMFVEAIRQGGLDSKLSGTIDEPHPEWKGTLDWLGVQYYFRGGVTSYPAIFPPPISATPCYSSIGGFACVPPLDPTYYVPVMQYEHDPAGLYAVLTDFAKRWPGLPLIVTESGIATQVGARRAEVIVRALEQIDRAKKDGADVRGYYHWSIFDNFEWALGFVPRFGLYSVDYTTYARTPTEGATVFGEIAQSRKLTTMMRTMYGGSGPLTPEAPDGG
jgi:beta-glucosidase